MVRSHRGYPNPGYAQLGPCLSLRFSSSRIRPSEVHKYSRSQYVPQAAMGDDAWLGGRGRWTNQQASPRHTSAHIAAHIGSAVGEKAPTTACVGGRYKYIVHAPSNVPPFLSFSLPTHKSIQGVAKLQDISRFIRLPPNRSLGIDRPGPLSISIFVRQLTSTL